MQLQFNCDCNFDQICDKNAITILSNINFKRPFDQLHSYMYGGKLKTKLTYYLQNKCSVLVIMTAVKFLKTYSYCD